MLSTCLLNRLPLFSYTWYEALLFHDSNSRVVSKLTGAVLQCFCSIHVRSRFFRSLPFSCPHLYAAASLNSIISRKEALPSSSVLGTSICKPTSPSLLLAFTVGRTGSVGGSVDGLAAVDDFVDEELLAGASVVPSLILIVLSDNWSVNSGVVSEVDTLTRVSVIRVGFKATREVITTLAVVVAGVLSDDDLN